MNNLWKSDKITNPKPPKPKQFNKKKKNIYIYIYILKKKNALEVFEGHPFTNTSGRGQTPNLSPQIHK